MRIGFGYDVHALMAGRPLIIGGVNIPAEKGAMGHSDADVLIHAIMDALLGAAALGDIGRHFPDTDPGYLNIDSKVLLQKVMDMIASKGLKVGNIDATICLQQPRIAPHIPAMIKALCPLLNVHEDQLSVKATTTEHLGFTGRGEGIAAHAVVLLV